MLVSVFEASRSVKRIISLIYDAGAIAFSLLAAMLMRLGVIHLDNIGYNEVFAAVVTLILSICIFVKLGLYRAILRYMAHQVLLNILLGVFLSGAILAASIFFLQASVPRSVPLIYIFTSLFFVGVPRLLICSIINSLNKVPNKSKENIAIYGAGRCGFELVNSLTGSKYNTVTFIDDNPKLQRTLLRGLPINQSDKLPELINKYNLKHVLLALGNCSRSQRSIIVKRLEPLGVGIKTMPPIGDILSGKSQIEDIRDIEIEDLLAREPVKPQYSLFAKAIKNRNVLVTGAGGSIGSELCRQILSARPRCLVLFELNEFNLYQIEQELKSHIDHANLNVAPKIMSIIGSVKNRRKLEDAFRAFEIEIVYHAAAYKHVPLIEHNIIEGVENNILGTWHCAEAAINAGVNSFVLVSTDKAVRPTNVMGATKRMAELVVQALCERQSNTRFTMVRFGNVLGSSGSVVPLFRRQIQQGGPITVTDAKVLRYFMTIPEAAELVLQAGSMGKGGDVFVLDMGKPVKILDLAHRMIHLSGLTLKDEYNPNGDVEIKFTGLRPGEKLVEELLIGDNVAKTDHPRIWRAQELTLDWPTTKKLLNEFIDACKELNCQKVHAILLKAPTQFQPVDNEINDSVWRASCEIEAMRADQRVVSIKSTPSKVLRSI